MDDPAQTVDLRAESSVIGSMIRDPTCVPSVMDSVKPSDFYHPFNETVFRTIVSMHDNAEPADMTTLPGRVPADELQRAGGAVALFKYMEDTPTAANVDYYCRIVTENSARRRIQHVGTRMVQLATASDTDVDEVIDACRSEVESIARHQPSASTLLDDFLAIRDTLGERIDGIIPTPWPELDELIGGLAPGRFYLLAARPSVGKSIGAAQIALTLSEHGACVLSSLEMSKRELVIRMTSNLANVPMHALQGLSDMTTTFRRRLSHVSHQMSDKNLYIDDSTGATPASIRAFARTIHRRHGPLRGLIIDYLQLMSTGKRTESRQVEVSGMSRSMKLLAKELDVPIIVLSQLNREVEQRQSHIPVLSDLRESGSLEQDADVVMFLSMEVEEDPVAGEDVESDHVVRLTVAKNRHGPKGWLRLDRDGTYSRMLPPPQLL